METIGVVSHTEAAQRGPAPRVWALRAYLGLAGLFVFGVCMQALLAGAAIFAGGSWMAAHRAIGHLMSSPIPLIPLLLLIFSFAGRLPGAIKWGSGLLLFLALIQPAFLYLRGVAPLIGALHPLNALLLFGLPISLIAKVRRASRAQAR